MKKFMTDIKTLAALLMAGAAFTACSSSDDNIIEQPQNPTEPQVYTMVIKASKGGDATTRALQPGTDSETGKNTVDAYWSGDETIEVYQSGEKIGEATAAPSNNGNTTITATLTSAPDPLSDLNFYLGGLTSDYTGQVGLLTGANSISEKYDYVSGLIYSNAFTVNGLNVIPGENSTLTFDAAQQAIIKFTLQDKGNGNAAISPSALTVTDGTSTVSLTSIPPATYSDPKNGAGVLYVAFPAAGSAKTITLTATVGSDTYTYTTSSAKTFVNGQYYEITVKMTKQVTITDLSMVDCAGNARANGMSTANCYMVHTAGNYKLPLVYGNAIKNGADYTAAYNPGGTTSTNYCANFVNHADQAITAPWIKDNNITVTQAELLWQDAEGLITAVGIDGDYLTLTVGEDATTQEGNAVIAAKAGETIVWSWHIWVTKQTFATADLTDINTDNHTYSVTPVNLGWVGDATSTTGYCTFYQWGRKDAFIPSTGIKDNTTNHTVYNISNETVTGFSNTSDKNVTIGGSIQHPTEHYLNTSTYSPCNTKYYNMWDAQQTSDDENTAAATVKTVYDPCPPGFCVPTSGLYYYIASQTLPAGWSTDYTYSGVFFPASGYRYFGSGDLTSVGAGGRYWSATPRSVSQGRYFSFDSDSWALNLILRAMGSPVRAVAE